MAAGNIARVMRASGRLIANPTEDFDDGTYPYGGTELGKVSQAILQPLGTNFLVWDESRGEVIDVLESNSRHIFGCFLRGWDDDAVESLLSDGFEAGHASSHAMYSVPGFVTPGQTARGRGLTIAYIPDDEVNVNGLILYNAIPSWTEGAELAFSRNSELGIPLTCECLRDEFGNILRIGRTVDLPLS